MKTFREFWPFYVGEHLHPTNRRLHFIGTSLTILVALTAILRKEYILLIAVPFVGYGFAWTGHLVFEKNRPATFKYPVKSLIADYKMFFYMATFRMNNEIRRIQGANRMTRKFPESPT